ncbi:MAG TPA: hypothetical protein VJW23_01970 [Propionibacteriaceae bacterium]|nr:hypothetical protein [Propionibacteriaceae bacterium]
MPNLDEVTFYDDEVDQWAAQREFELRITRYERAKGGVMVPILQVTESLKRMHEAIVGIS